MQTTSDPLVLSRGDRASLWFTIVAGAAAIAGILVLLSIRVVEILANRAVPVLLPFVDATAELPLGPNGALVTVQVEQATAAVSQMPAITVASLVFADVVSGLAACAVIVFLCLFCRNLMRGRAFGPANTGLITATSFTILGGWFFGSLFSTMGVNGAFAALSDNTYDNVAFETSFTPMFAAFAVGAIAYAFQAGARLQRDTEGLV
jgi:hypothetical protein